MLSGCLASTSGGKLYATTGQDVIGRSPRGKKKLLSWPSAACLRHLFFVDAGHGRPPLRDSNRSCDVKRVASLLQRLRLTE